MTNREAVKTLKNTAVGNRDGLKWKVLRVSSTTASDARKKAGIPKEATPVKEKTGLLADWHGGQR